MPQNVQIRCYNRLDNMTGEIISTECATEDELLEFANRLRKAGAAEPLDALFPSTPGDPHSCLIANALNFSSQVQGGQHSDRKTYFPDGSDTWIMITKTEVAQKAKKELGLKFDISGSYGIEPIAIIDLPKEIGNAASAFDNGKAFTDYNEHY